MGWAGKNISRDQREVIARSLFQVTTVDGPWLNGICPLHDDKNASFGYNVDDDVFKCLAACTDSGDLIDLYAALKGLDRKEGFKAFRSAFGAIIGMAKRQTPGRIARQASAPAAGLAPQPTATKNNLEIPESVIDTLEHAPQAMLDDLREIRGWSADVISRLGIKALTHFRKKTSLYSLFPLNNIDRVAIPIRDNSGVLRNIRCYYPFGKPENATAKIMSWGKGHGSAMLFPAASTLGPGPVILCEGEADCICALSKGLNAITQTGKPDKWPKDHLAALKGREIVIAYDADKPGDKYALKAADNLVSVGCKVRLLVWPDFMGRQEDGTWPDDKGQDLTDYFVRHGRSLDDFKELVGKAKYVGQGRPAAMDSCPWAEFFERGINDRVSFRERKLADYLIDKNTMLYHDASGQLYKFGAGVYEAWSVDQLKRAAIDALGPEATSSRVGAVAQLCMSMVSMPQGREINDRNDWACLKNGMLNLRTLEFVDHDPDYMSTVMLGVSWHGAEPPCPTRWLQFLSETIQTQGPIDQLQEFFGYSMTRDTRFAKALLLLGPGSDGKSKVIKMLREIVGAKNCSAVPFAGLEDQFQRAALFGKMLNIGAEVTTDALQSEFFKAIVTGDSIQASFKHKDSFEFTPYCKLVYAMNKRPKVLDNSDGFFRRILPIQFKRQFLENDAAMDPDLEDKLMLEIDGIFAWALQGLHRLLEQKRFTTCEETADFILAYRRYNSPVMAFVQDCCEIENELESDLKDIYPAYKKYCRENGYGTMNRENFKDEIQTAVRKIKENAAVKMTRPREANGTRPYMICGVGLNKDVAQTMWAEK